MPLDFLTRIARSKLPQVVSNPVDMDLLRQCAAAGYLEVRPLAIRGGATPLMVAAKVVRISPDGEAVMRDLQVPPRQWQTGFSNSISR